MFLVYSKSLITGNVTHGTKAYSKEQAQAFADELNADPNYKGILECWIEPVDQSDEAAPAAIDMTEEEFQAMVKKWY